MAQPYRARGHPSGQRPLCGAASGTDRLRPRNTGGQGQGTAPKQPVPHVRGEGRRIPWGDCGSKAGADVDAVLDAHGPGLVGPRPHDLDGALRGHGFEPGGHGAVPFVVSRGLSSLSSASGLSTGSWGRFLSAGGAVRTRRRPLLQHPPCSHRTGCWAWPSSPPARPRDHSGTRVVVFALRASRPGRRRSTCLCAVRRVVRRRTRVRTRRGG